MSAFSDDIEDVVIPYSDVIITGDFNCNSLNDMTLITQMSCVGLSRVNISTPTHFSTNNNTLLDMFFINDKSKILLYDQLSVPQFSKHDLIFMCYDFICADTNNYFYYRDFKKINYDELCDSLLSIHWDHIYYMTSINQQVEFLQDNILMLYNKHVKIRKKILKNETKPWFNREVKTAIFERDQA